MSAPVQFCGACTGLLQNGLFLLHDDGGGGGGGVREGSLGLTQMIGVTTPEHRGHLHTHVWQLLLAVHWDLNCIWLTRACNLGLFA